MKKCLVAIIISVCITVSGCVDYGIESESDSEFEAFLNETMVKYRDWLKRTENDPSTPINHTVLLSRNWGHLTLTCNISNQTMRDHSRTIDDSAFSTSDFENHYLWAGRQTHSRYYFQGDLNCSGLVLATGFEDVQKNIAFNVTGNWTLTANKSVESVKLFNVGITEEGRFNLNQSWISYHFTPTIAPAVQFNGSWEDDEGGEEIVKHKDKVLSVFRSLYYEFIGGNDNHSPNDTNPSRRLFLDYFIDNVIKNTLVYDLISSDLPTYTPTPSTSTMPTPTTTKATQAPTSSTGKETNPTTQSEATTNYGLTFISTLVALSLINRNIWHSVYTPFH